MKLKSFFIFVIVICALSVCACPAFSQMNPDEKIKAYEATIDRLIENCSQKSAMINSNSENIRNEAKTALMKASFYKKNKDLLVEEMMENGIQPKQYAVTHYLNEIFFAIVRDHDPKVAEAYSEPDQIK